MTRPSDADASPSTSAGARTSWLPPLLALAVALLGFLPIANWIDGGHAVPWYRDITGEWTNGALIVLGAGIVLAIVSRRVPILWRDGLCTPLVEWADSSPRAFGALVGALALALYLGVAVSILSARPLFIDELIQVLQAQIFAEGRLWRPAPPYPEFSSALHVLDGQGRLFTQFPPGGPAMLTLGVLLGAPWLIGPLCGAIATFAFWMFLRAAEPRASVAVGATLLFAFAPFAAFMFGSHMNHVTTLMWLVVAMAMMARVMRSESPRPLLAFGNGLALGIAATIRPVDALAFALPAAAWYFGRALRAPARWADVLGVGVGVLVPVAAMMWVNASTTGHPLLFGYELLWGKSHALGFHRAPWGVTHTPARGLELINLYFLRLQTYLFETPLPSMVPVVGALALTRRVNSFDRYLFASSALLIAMYFAYWHDGFFLGPRFMFPLLPALALCTARFPALIRERLGDGLPHRTAVYGYLVAAVVALVVSVPIRSRDYASGLATMRVDFVDLARHAGVRDALIFVRESWGTQVMSRMWALGVPRSESETLYRGIDTCVLDDAVTVLERSGIRDSSALRALSPLLRDSARVVKTVYSKDVSERMLPGFPYGARCLRRLSEDRAGFTLLAPLLVVDWESNVYARDLHARDTLLLQRFPNRPLYLMRPTSNEFRAPLQLIALARDSLEAAWRAER